MKKGWLEGMLAKVLLGLVLVFPQLTTASEVTIRPFLIDQTLAPRDVGQSVVTLKSDYDVRKAVLYATVNEITVDSVGEIKEFVSPVMTDRTNTITSWIEVTRGRIEVLPGETVEVPIAVRVHPYAEPGEYHAFIGFVETSNRPKAEAIALAGEAKGVLLKIVVSDDRVDTMRVASFLIDRFITNSTGRSVAVEIENTGDIASVPTGEIVFYDSRGIEVTSVPVNTDAQSVSPGEKVTLTTPLPLDDDLGRYKANLSLQYGLDQRASLYDTTYFYLMPWHILLMIFGAILLVTIVAVLLFRKVFFTPEYDQDCQDVTMYVREGHEPNPKDHDIDLKNSL